MASTNNGTEAFPPIEPTASSATGPQTPSADNVSNRPAASSSLSGRLRRVSLSFEQSEIPEGFMAATGGIASSIFTRQAPPRPMPAAAPIASSAAQAPTIENSVLKSTPIHSVPEEPTVESKHDGSSVSATQTESGGKLPAAAAPFANGYHFPPKYSFAQSTKMGSIAFWNYSLTPVGFLVTLYGMNVVAWGGMLFLLLCNASPAMCHPTCNDINSPRRKWVEWDSQIVNALFCVTGFGLAPWRFRDLYFLLGYRILGKSLSLRKLAAIHRGWFRLQGSTELSPEIGPRNVEKASIPADSTVVPFPDAKIPDAPLTGVRAPATPLWKLDLVIWFMVGNTFLQCVLCGFMWGMNRHNRPSWATGTFVALGCISAALGGFIMFLEGKAVKGIEGVPLSQIDLERLEKDRELGIFHYNNIKDEDPEAQHHHHHHHDKNKEKTEEV